jgi:predicted Ser/Thr protein kinase
MNKLSTGDDSTLGNYKKLAEIFFGADSLAVNFLNEKISKSLKGENEEVIADERQMIYLLANLGVDKTGGVNND